MLRSLAVGAAGLLASPALAADEAFEFWLNPSVTVAIDDKTETELETVARLRSSEDNRVDTYYARLWIGRKLSDAATLGVAVEQRINGRQNETRLHQQLSLSTGAFRSRTRLEQRFVQGDPRMGLRVRQRLGVSVPFGKDERFAFIANTEGFFVLRATTPTGSTGLTALRHYLGAEYDVSKNLTVGLGYMRNQEIRRGRPDVIGNAPLIGIAFSF